MQHTFWNVQINRLHKTTLPIFTSKEFAVRRRYSDFEWLKTKMENKFKVFDTLRLKIVHPLVEETDDTRNHIISAILISICHYLSLSLFPNIQFLKAIVRALVQLLLLID